MRCIFVCALMALSPALAQDAANRTVVEDLIAAQHPCRSLTTRIAGQRIGIDTLEDLSLDRADISLIGDDLALGFQGSLVCRTSSAAFLKGNAGARIDASAKVQLSDCEKATVRVTLSEATGSFAAILDALRPTLELQIAEAARPELVGACQKLLSKDR